MRTWMKRREPQDDGVALLTVLFAIFVISSFLLVSLQYGLRGSTASRKDQDAKIATAAAKAGLDEYMARLNAVPGYNLQLNNDPSNSALTTSGPGRTIQGTGSAGASYRYQVLNTVADFNSTGVVRVQVTGTSRNVTRKLTANLRAKGFLNNIYLSDYEVIDPILAGLTGTTAANCSKYYFQGRNTAAGCSEIQWTGSDTVNGPLHSNDALQINGPVRFTESAETGCPKTLLVGNSTMCAPPKTWWGTQVSTGLPDQRPEYAAPIPLPDQNSTLATETTPGPDNLQTGDGCYYTGATKITFTGTTMSVYSPATTSASTPTRCFNVSNRSVEQVGLAIPPVIYVDGTSNSCVLGTVGFPKSGEAVVVGGVNDNYWRSSSTLSNKTTNYDCHRGTAYVSGSADAQVTLATAADIVVTGNLRVTDNMTGTDVIGLIATNNIWVYHPIDSSTNNLLPAASAVTTIQAAILSVNHSFVAQNWADGSPVGTLNVSGAIAQKFRGPVNTGSATAISTGYYKNYVYDPRLAFLQPPYFLASSANIWIVSSVTDN
jgi:hypothetical protein